MARPKKLTRSMLTSLAVVLLMASSALRLFAADDGADQPDKTQKLLPTHKQVLTIRPEMNGEPTELATFCLDQSGNILACVSGTGNALQFLTPTGELIRQIDLPFAPQGIGQSPSGIIFLAGPGKLAKLSAEGEILTIVDSPWLGDVEQMKKEAQVAAEEQMEAVMRSFTEMIEKIDARIAKMEEKPEADRTERDFKRLQAMKEQKKTQEEQAAEMKNAYGPMFSVEAMLDQRMRVTALAVNEQDLFVCSGGAGYSYEVWRMNHEFAEPTKVVDALSGCCGQCDIQCDQDHLIIAANTKFSVELLDRDGKAVSKFGQQGGQNGFGSCCNPMNVRPLGSGDILTAESSIGWIKRFNKDGELKAVIGKAKIGGGCKHVPIGFDAKLDRYYMMYEDKSEICVLVPLSEATEPTADEIASKEARDGLGQKLIGQWQAVPVSKNKPETAGESVPAIKIVPANDAESNADGAKAERKVNETITIEAGKGDAKVVAGENVTATSGTVVIRLQQDESTQDTADSNGNDAAQAEDAMGLVLGADGSFSFVPTWLEFFADGKMKSKGSAFGAGELQWEAIRQSGQVLTIAQVEDEVVYLEYQIEFLTDDKVKVSAFMSEQSVGSSEFNRVEAASEKGSSSQTDPQATGNQGNEDVAKEKR